MYHRRDVILNSNLKHKNKTYYTDSGENDMQLLTRLANEGLLRIWQCSGTRQSGERIESYR
jgi:hypothetical protein